MRKIPAALILLLALLVVAWEPLEPQSSPPQSSKKETVAGQVVVPEESSPSAKELALVGETTPVTGEEQLEQGDQEGDQETDDTQPSAEESEEEVAAPEVKGEESEAEIGEQPLTYLVTRVIDGDTIEIEGGQKIRYIGIDTPESVHPQKPIECFAVEAAKKNKELVEGKRVRLEKDISETDRYGRLLRYVFVGDLFVNDYLVRWGYAYSSTYPPDVKYQDQFRQAEREARENNRGLWSACQEVDEETPTPTDCVIKGNINWEGEKIYHLPGCASYDRTKIDESRGERWFCSEEEAVAAGWREAKNCSD